MFAANGAYVDNANAWGPTSCRKVAPHWTREGFAAPSKKLTVIVGQPYHMKNKEWAKYKQEKRIINFNCNAPKGKSCVIDATLLQTSGINPSMPFSKTVNIHYKPTETDRTFEVKYVYLKK